MDKFEVRTWKQIQTPLYQFVFKKVKDKDLANDLMQDVFLKVQGRVNQLRDDSKITSWIYQITRNAILDYFKAREKEQNLSVVWENENQELNECVADCLNKLVDTLPEKYKQAVRMADLEDQSQTELATQLGISYSGLKSRVQRGREMLREKLLALYHVETDSYGNVLVCENKVACQC